MQRLDLKDSALGLFRGRARPAAGVRSGPVQGAEPEPAKGRGQTTSLKTRKTRRSAGGLRAAGLRLTTSGSLPGWPRPGSRATTTAFPFQKHNDGRRSLKGLPSPGSAPGSRRRSASALRQRNTHPRPSVKHFPVFGPCFPGGSPLAPASRRPPSQKKAADTAPPSPSAAAFSCRGLLRLSRKCCDGSPRAVASCPGSRAVPAPPATCNCDDNGFAKCELHNCTFYNVPQCRQLDLWVVVSPGRSAGAVLKHVVSAVLKPGLRLFLDFLWLRGTRSPRCSEGRHGWAHPPAPARWLPAASGLSSATPRCRGPAQASKVSWPGSKSAKATWQHAKTHFWQHLAPPTILISPRKVGLEHSRLRAFPP